MVGAGHFEEQKDKPKDERRSTSRCARIRRPGTISTPTSRSTRPPRSARPTSWRWRSRKQGQGQGQEGRRAHPARRRQRLRLATASSAPTATALRARRRQVARSATRRSPARCRARTTCRSSTPRSRTRCGSTARRSWRRRWCWPRILRRRPQARPRGARRRGEAVMNVRGAAVQSGLAALGLVVAYTTWQREPERAPGEVMVVDVNKSDVQKVRFEDGTASTSSSSGARRDATRSRACGCKLSADPKPKTPAREVPATRAPSGCGTSSRRCGRRARSACSTPDKLKELGLDAPKKKLEVTARGVEAHVRHRRLAVRRVRSVRQGRAATDASTCSAAGIISDLDSAGVRLVDRQLHALQAGRLRQRHHHGGRQEARACRRRRRRTRSPAKLRRTPRPASPTRWPRTGTTRSGASRSPRCSARARCRPTARPRSCASIEYGWKGKPKGFVELGHVAPPPAGVERAGAADASDRESGRARSTPRAGTSCPAAPKK